MMIESYSDGCSRVEMAFDTSTAIMTGMMCRIWPVISDTTTQIEIEWVTPAENAAAPTMAYPPGDDKRA